uniref:Cyclin-like domain-containing protein n=1 Tax=Chenopodium quinoa TaxID=63459 RepID=A0A803M4L8_CHEQI
MAELENINSVPNMITFLSSLLQRVAESNDITRRLEPQKVSVFHGLTRPTISVQSYLERIFKYANCSPSCFVVAYVYLDRFTQRQPLLPINSYNVHRLLITSVMISAKFMDDIHEPIEGNELTPAQRKELKKRFGGPKVYKPSPELSKPTEEEPFRRSPRLKGIVIHDREAEERLPRAEKVNANTHKGKGKLTAADKGKAKVGDETGNHANLVRKIKERVRSLRDDNDVFTDEDGDTESSDSELSDFELEVDEGEEDLYSDDDEEWLKKNLDHINSEVKGSLRGVTKGGDQSDDEDTGFDIERNLQIIEAALKLPQYQPPTTAQAGSSNAAPATAVSIQPATRTEPLPTQPVTRSNRSLSQPTRVPTTTPPKVKIQTRSKLHVMTSKKDKDLNQL